MQAFCAKARFIRNLYTFIYDIAMKNFVEELRWRGMLQDMMPGTEEQLMKEPTAAYLGIDPTADSLHIGHLCGIMMLKHLQTRATSPSH